MSSSAFGGAKTVLVAKSEPIKKTSAQTIPEGVDVIQHPFSDEYGALIPYFASLQDKQSFHGLSLAVKTTTSFCLGIDSLSESQDKIDHRLAVVNEYGQSFSDVMRQAGMDFHACGAGAIEVVPDTAGRPAELYYMPADRVYFRPRGASTPFMYLNDEGVMEPWPAFRPGERDNSILYLPNQSNGHRLYGLPDWTGCLPDIELDYYATRYNQNFFLNSGIPDLAVIVEGGSFDEDTEKAVLSFLQSNIKGLDNSHKTLYLPIPDQDVKVRFEKIAGDMKDRDLAFEKLRLQCRDNILSAHRVPPRVAGVVTSGQLGGGGEIFGQIQLFQETTIQPYQVAWERRLNQLFEAMDLGVFRFARLDGNFSEPPSAYYSAMVGSGVLTIDEAREELGYAPSNTADATPEETLTDALKSFRKSVEI